MDDPEFREFVQARYTDLLRTAYLLTGNRDAAQDLVHEALLKVMRHWRRVDEPIAYVRRAMVNERTSRWRRVGLRELLTSTVPDRAGPDSTDGVAVRDELLAALDRLPVRMRTVLVLRYWEDLPEAEVAAVMDCSLGTVKSQAARGLARLREVLAASRPKMAGGLLGERA
ncbi:MULTISPECIES: SigE family RNA polymerase sigma factor [Micromonospora]|uniref:SigE family RNA polymerase sigma factor n=1 Tax=Micromonospora solifontis TaxID=2487138 RepID=A0ABX9WFP8_9ACTN|nr:MULTISPECIES: SigE family RNA polymerase sigma factor [Micromonospora]NES13984.1 SigE family RNA polymerase sigma factor [Micromonospora sp. PPF5-17B]NES37115.1 SigE family RNA polymerase sigma factor [Micromonospora solifontis]NES54084.1 SigE family RNA polymerase sigma factor [Micromonospora sp. PPF5-6]RNL98671.1 SigE family RNA polymerase sigma factor [Micromonospora solifontis]